MSHRKEQGKCKVLSFTVKSIQNQAMDGHKLQCRWRRSKVVRILDSLNLAAISLQGTLAFEG